MNVKVVSNSNREKGRRVARNRQSSHEIDMRQVMPRPLLYHTITYLTLPVGL